MFDRSWARFGLLPEQFLEQQLWRSCKNTSLNHLLAVLCYSLICEQTKNRDELWGSKQLCRVEHLRWWCVFNKKCFIIETETVGAKYRLLNSFGIWSWQFCLYGICTDFLIWTSMKCFFFFFFPNSKHFSDPTFLVHTSMEYLIITSQNLKSGFFHLRQNSREEYVKLGISEPSKGDGGKVYIFAKFILFV